MSVHIEALYKNAPATLWVEDPETRILLQSLWMTAAPTIQVLVAGGHENVSAVCKQATDLGVRHVFGLVDQDFGRSNRARWSSLPASERVYRIDVHEVENLLLESQALANCSLNTKRRTQVEIENRLLNIAQNRAWWFACARFLSETKSLSREGFPPDPPPSLSSLTDAETYVNGSKWFSTTAASCPALATTSAVSTGLSGAHTQSMAALADGSWRTIFPGKQIFREVSGFIHQTVPGARAHYDLIKSIGEWLRTNGTPAQVMELRSSILARITP